MFNLKDDRFEDPGNGRIKKVIIEMNRDTDDVPWLNVAVEYEQGKVDKAGMFYPRGVAHTSYEDAPAHEDEFGNQIGPKSDATELLKFLGPTFGAEDDAPAKGEKTKKAIEEKIIAKGIGTEIAAIK